MTEMFCSQLLLMCIHSQITWRRKPRDSALSKGSRRSVARWKFNACVHVNEDSETLAGAGEEQEPIQWYISRALANQQRQYSAANQS